MPRSNAHSVPGASPRAVRQGRPATVFERWPAYFAISFLGIAGFVGLLAAAHYLPQWAHPLRIGALIWFAWFGVIRLATTPPR